MIEAGQERSAERSGRGAGPSTAPDEGPVTALVAGPVAGPFVAPGPASVVAPVGDPSGSPDVVPGPAPDAASAELATQLGRRLADAGLWFTAAESCTGGLVAAAVTGVPGSSAWFGAGFVTYSNAAKQAMLGVPEETIARDGAVSDAVVRAMASGARARAEADVAVSVSGVAGPGGGSVAKPVGTVWIAWALADGRLESALLHFPGERDEVRAAAVREALRGTIARLPESRPSPS